MHRHERDGLLRALHARRVLIVAAHPDDEVIGAGAQLPRMRHVTLVHVTDGAPRSGADVAASGCATAAEYAAVRRRELQAAVALAGIPPDRLQCLDCPDQAATPEIASLARRLTQLLEALGPELVVTHPYEGGHPDHDATALAVHAARRLLASAGAPVPLLVEMGSYHAGPRGLESESFLPPNTGLANAPTLVRLSREDCALKARMIDCYRTQRRALQYFRFDRECFRQAPHYDFGRPPHAGRLYYENFAWGTTGETFRTCAAGALDSLGLPPVL